MKQTTLRYILCISSTIETDTLYSLIKKETYLKNEINARGTQKTVLFASKKLRFQVKMHCKINFIFHVSLFACN